MNSDSPDSPDALDTDRPRGILTERNREYIKSPPDQQEISGRAERKARKSIRERIYNGILDFAFIHQLDRDERGQIFQTVQKSWVYGGAGLSLNRLFGFLYTGLTEQGLQSDFFNGVEQAVKQYEEERALSDGKIIEYSVDIEVSVAEETPIEEVFEKYKNREDLSFKERRALVNNGKIDVDYVDSQVYYARRLKDSFPVDDIGDSDPERKEEITSRLREIFSGRDWEVHGQYHPEPADPEVGDLMRELREVVEPLHTPEEHREMEEEQIEELERRIENREPIDHFRPPSVDDWNPAEDDTLHRLLALREAGLTKEEWQGDMSTPVEERYGLRVITRRWIDDDELESIKEAADFDAEEYDFETISKDLDELREKVKGKEGKERWQAIADIAETSNPVAGGAS